MQGALAAIVAVVVVVAAVVCRMHLPQLIVVAALGFCFLHASACGTLPQGASVASD